MTRMFAIFRWLWPVLAVGLLVYGLDLALLVSPVDAEQGNMMRIFYYHFPNWIATFIFLSLNLGSSVVYLSVRDRNFERAMKADSFALASAELGVLYCSLGLITGSIWGRAAWGIWWTWDARLTTTLILWLIYVGYLYVRNSITGEGMPVVSAVLAIFGFCDIPIVYMATRWWRTQHPAPVFGGGPDSGIAPGMRSAVWWNVIAWVFWGLVMLKLRYGTELRRQRRVLTESFDDTSSHGLSDIHV